VKSFTTSAGVTLAYADDYFGAPWSEADAQAVLLIHGTAESSRAWFGVVPALSDRYRLIRPDLPGFGASPIADDVPYNWTTARLAADLKQLTDQLGLRRFHVVGAKYGGAVAVDFAATYPDHVLTLSVISGPVQVRGQSGGGVDGQQYEYLVNTYGPERWAADSMDKRLGQSASAQQRAAWTKLMGASGTRATRQAVYETNQLDLLHKLPAIAAPALFVTMSGSALASLDNFRKWTGAMKDASLVVIDGDGYHPAVMYPRETAAAVARHLERASASAKLDRDAAD
jgi:pimeloyl-ACP methyl ester carboxylesterase